MVFHSLNRSSALSIIEKNRWGAIFFLFLILLLDSCSILTTPTTIKKKSNQSLFFDKAEVYISSNNSQNSNTENSVIGEINDQMLHPLLNDIKSIEYIPISLFRYAVILDIEVEKLSNPKLIEYIHQWWGVPYKYGGGSMNGIDCSNFVKGITQYTYGITLPRTSRDQAAFCKTIDKTELKEGDLVFFNTGVGISHVGFYLANDKFVHASSSLGVVISSLNETYWKKRFVKAGRMEIRN